jgi:hypothetical protein
MRQPGADVKAPIETARRSLLEKTDAITPEETVISPEPGIVPMLASAGGTRIDSMYPVLVDGLTPPSAVK